MTDERNGMARILRSTWGALLALALAAAAGSTMALLFNGLTGLPKRVETQEQDLAELRRAEAVEFMADTIRFGAIERRLVWIICSTIPPNERDVLAALEIACPSGGPEAHRPAEARP